VTPSRRPGLDVLAAPTEGTDRPDLRLVPGAVAAWVAAMMALAAPPTTTAWLAAPAALCGLLLLRRRTHPVVAVTLLCAAAAASCAALRLVALAQGPLGDLARAGAAATVELVVTSDPRTYVGEPPGTAPTSEVVVLDALADSVQARGRTTDVRTPIVVLVPGLAGADWLGLSPGHRLRASGVLDLPRDGDAVAAVLVVRGPPGNLAPLTSARHGAERLRSGLREAVDHLPAEERGLLPGLVVGDTSEMPAALDEDFRATGMTHLTAVSGTNVTIVVAFVLYAGRWLGVRARAGPLVAAVAMAGFVVIARTEPSVVRAAAMGLVALVALASGRRRIGMPALAAAVLALILLDPWLARSYGFALSVLATAGLLVLVPPLAQRLSTTRIPHFAWRPPLWLCQAVAIPIAAQIACAPVVAMLAAEVSLVAVPANLLAAPAVAPATICGVLAAITAPLSPTAATVLGTLGGAPTWWIVTVAETAARLPAGAVPWPDGTRGGVLLALALLALAVAAPVLRAGWRRRPVLVVAGLSAGGALGLPLSPLGPGASWPPPGWLMVACSVGQGDALVLAAGPAAGVVVDAGPDPAAVDRCLRDLGVEEIPLVILTHLDADHVDGLAGVLEGRTVGAVQVGPLAEPERGHELVRAATQAAGVTVIPVRLGEQRRVGDLHWQVLWPSRVIRGEESAPNNASIVLLVQRDGVRLLLTGDIEPSGQRALLDSGILSDAAVDVLKVPHHGSAHQDPRLFATLAPRVAVVSAGEDNPYGHPAASTVTALEGAGALVARTDRDGDVAVVGPVEALRVVRRDG
jgi:competence protein ComEC